MIGNSAGSGQIIAVATATLASVVVIITTVRTWLRSFVDDRIDLKLASRRRRERP